MKEKKKLSKRRTTFYQELCKQSNLLNAWNHVYANIQKSDYKNIREDGKKYKQQEVQNIQRIIKLLKKPPFKFKARAIPIEKKNKAMRPVASIETDGRIVQRCALDILQNHTGIKKYYEITTSFGGIKRKGIYDAVKAICKTFKDNNYTYYITTDIKSFFTKIKTDKVISEIRTFCKDEQFIQILDNSINLEIKNIKEIEENHPELLAKYRYDIEGVPQGSCLSPLFGNIYLYDLDVYMNEDSGVAFFRYIDDVIIIGKNAKTVKSAFNNKLLPKLKELGLSAYSFDESETKAQKGYIKNGFEFLGLWISDKVVRPSNDAVNKIKAEIINLLNDALNFKAKGKKTLSETLDDITKKIKGWGNHYWFCNGDREINNLDINLDCEINKFIKEYFQKLEKLSPCQIRDKIGITRALICAKHKGKTTIMVELKKEKD